jgi:DNA-binding NarL/FixJ family response regulator
MIRIAVINEKESEQNLVQTALALHSDFEVVGYGRDGFDALKLVSKFKPDIMIMDTHLSDVNETELIPLLRIKSPHIAFLILTSFTEEVHISKMINLGITAYLLKETDMDTLPLAIRTLHNGGYFFSPRVSDKVFHILLDMIKTNKASEKPMQSATNTRSLLGLGKAPPQNKLAVDFSRVELRLILLVAQGYSSEDIAGRLNLSGGTIRNYLSAMLQRTGLRNRTQLAMFAIKNGLISQPHN